MGGGEGGRRGGEWVKNRQSCLKEGEGRGVGEEQEGERSTIHAGNRCGPASN